MNLEIYSDLHLEFHRNQGRKFLHRMNPEGVDALVLAGDITVEKHLNYVLRTMCEAYAPRPVIFVPGNHEHYDSSREAVNATLRRLQDRHDNLYYLDKETVEIEGVVFAGATLWFASNPLNIFHESGMNDFRLIADFRAWVYDENVAAQAFLRESCAQPVDVVVTHHGPSAASTHPLYKGDALNRFYYTEMSDALVGEVGPQLWIHGHTHFAMDYTIGSTRIYSNPRGYPQQKVPGYRGRHLIEIQPREA